MSVDGSHKAKGGAPVFLHAVPSGAHGAAVLGNTIDSLTRWHVTLSTVGPQKPSTIALVVSPHLAILSRV